MNIFQTKYLPRFIPGVGVVKIMFFCFKIVAEALNTSDIKNTIIQNKKKIQNKRPLGLTAPLSNCLCYTNHVDLSRM